MTFVDAVKQIMPKKTSGSLTEKLVDFIVNREDDKKPDDKFHPSSLFYMCPRCEIIKRIVPLSALPLEPLDIVTRAKFDIGTSLHHWYQNVYLGPMRILKGMWRCSECGDITGSTKTPILMPDKCGGCQRDDSWEYQECSITSEEWDIIGHVDGIIEYDREDCVLDLKTCDPDLFQKMTKPWPSAISQVQIYMWLLGLKKGLLLYIDKSSNGPVPVKEFPVEYSTKTIDDVKGKITSFRMAMESRTLPDCMCGKSRFGVSCKALESAPGVSELIEKWQGGD